LAERPAAIIVAAVLCTLLAAIEQPDRSAWRGRDLLIAAFPVFATQFYLMPLASTFLRWPSRSHRGC